MVSLVIDNLPEEVAERLRRLAEQHGRSLAGEALAILSAASAAPLDKSNEPFGTAVNRRALELGMTEEAWADLEQSLSSARSTRGDSNSADPNRII